MRFLRWLAPVCLLISAVRLSASGVPATYRLLDEEETYELRLERIMNQHGQRAVFERLQQDMARQPRPYVKAWYANYLLYGADLGLKDIADPVRGFKLAQESRKEGSLFGLEVVGRAWGDGRGTGYRDSVEAVKCLRAAAEQGRDSAMCELAKFYFFGRVVPQDVALAEKWAYRAGCLGASSGLANLADFWDSPQFVKQPDHARALALYYQAAEFGQRDSLRHIRELAKAGDRLAEKYRQLEFLVAAREGAVARPAYVKATVNWLERHAAPNDWPVQLALAGAEMEITGPVYDPGAAREKLTRAAAAGVDDAREMLGWMAWRGIGQKRDPSAAIAVWRALAAKGNARALNALGWLHWWGNGTRYGVGKDARRAFELCRASADGGYFVGQENVADCYDHGIGTEVNYYLAAKYYAMLADRGFIHGREMEQRALAHVKD